MPDMSIRNSSGKFSLPHFGRKSSGVPEPSSPIRTGGNLDDPNSPGNSGFNNGGGGAASALDGLGKKLGKTIAHQSLLPGLGNKDLRVLQDIISAEKGVLASTDKLGMETQKAANALPPFGAQEGPDLQDVLTHSSTLLNQLSSALAVFADRSVNLRVCYKNIRQREEELDELRRRRRATGAKAETAEKKLAKMGPENKGLPSQTELLERLRGEMRQMDTDIINEESKIGDYKRQQVKEALSYKFGGLEELGEKMCIIGELGKLLLEEIPLEETPPGYGRAPYLGYDKTENAVNEATKCLATVKFVAGSVHPKAPGLPPMNQSERLGTPQLPNAHHISAAEEFATYPGGNDAASPNATRSGRGFALDESNPYGGMSQDHAYGEFGGMRAGHDAHVVFQGPPDDALHEDHRNGAGHDYEYEQQRKLDAENTANHDAAVTVLAPPAEVGPSTNGETSHGLNAPWQPLNVRKDRAATPVSLRDGAVPRFDAAGEEDFSRPSAIDLPPPPSLASLTAGGPGTPSERGDGFYTPAEATTPEPILTGQMGAPAPAPEPIPIPSPVPPPNTAQVYASTPGGGKISAAAFRRGAKQRGSGDVEEIATTSEHSPDSVNRTPRRLPLPPGETQPEGSSMLPTSPVIAQGLNQGEAYSEADALENPPPQYHSEAHPDSLR